MYIDTAKIDHLMYTWPKRIKKKEPLKLYIYALFHKTIKKKRKKNKRYIK